MEWKLREPAPVPRPAPQSVETYMNALETQVSSLQEFVHQMLPTQLLPTKSRSHPPSPCRQ